jgi:hypothetical protein
MERFVLFKPAGRRSKLPSDQTWLIEVTCYRVTDHFSELYEAFTLGENRVTESSCFITAFRRFFDNKNDFLVSHGATRWTL